MKKLETKKLTNRQLQAIETKNKIYDTAFELISTKGFGNITIEDISKKAKVSVGAFYHYFKSKDDILFEVYQRADNYFQENVLDQLKSESALDQIVEFFRYYARYSEQAKVGFTTHLYSTENKFFLKKGRLMQTILEDIIKKGQSSSEISSQKTSEEILDYLFLIARGVIFDWSLKDGNYALEERMTEIFRLQILILKEL